MSTLTEIESAVDQLSREQQEVLLKHLSDKLSSRKGMSSESVQQWMDRLDALRASIGTGRQSVSTDQILDESREERT
jgi:hypothetical protein